MSAGPVTHCGGVHTCGCPPEAQAAAAGGPFSFFQHCHGTQIVLTCGQVTACAGRTCVGQQTCGATCAATCHGLFTCAGPTACHPLTCGATACGGFHSCVDFCGGTGFICQVDVQPGGPGTAVGCQVNVAAQAAAVPPHTVVGGPSICDLVTCGGPTACGGIQTCGGVTCGPAPSICDIVTCGGVTVCGGIHTCGHVTCDQQPSACHPLTCGSPTVCGGIHTCGAAPTVCYHVSCLIVCTHVCTNDPVCQVETPAGGGPPPEGGVQAQAAARPVFGIFQTYGPQTCACPQSSNHIQTCVCHYSFNQPHTCAGWTCHPTLCGDVTCHVGHTCGVFTCVPGVTCVPGHTCVVCTIATPGCLPVTPPGGGPPPVGGVQVQAAARPVSLSFVTCGGPHTCVGVHTCGGPVSCAGIVCHHTFFGPTCHQISVCGGPSICDVVTCGGPTICPIRTCEVVSCGPVCRGTVGPQCAQAQAPPLPPRTEIFETCNLACTEACFQAQPPPAGAQAQAAARPISFVFPTCGGPRTCGGITCGGHTVCGGIHTCGPITCGPRPSICAIVTCGGPTQCGGIFTCGPITHCGDVRTCGPHTVCVGVSCGGAATCAGPPCWA